MAMNARMLGCGEVTLVLSHGYGSSQSIWNDVLPLLSRRYRILLFDWSFSSAANPAAAAAASAAYGPSECSSFDRFADDLVALLESTGLRRVVYVGHSMAGMVGCIASVRRPDLFAHLVLVGASPRYFNSEDYEGGFERKEIEAILLNIESDFLAWAKSFAALTIGVNDPKLVDKFSKSLQGMRPDVALSLARTIFFGDLRDVVEKVEVPCTIIQGSGDIVVPVSVARFMKSKMKGKVRVEIIESDGHFPQLTSPEVLVDVIDRNLMPIKKL